MRLPALLLILGLAACADPPSEPPPAVPPTGSPVALPDSVVRQLVAQDPVWAEALRIHYDALVLDGHVDTPSRMLDDGLALGTRSTASHLDAPRMAEGGLDAAFFALFVSRTYGEGAAATDRALAMLDEVKRQLDRLDDVELATTADDVERLARDRRRAILLGLEGGHALQGSRDVLRDFADRGVRYVTLTHVNANAWADSSQDAPRHGGLTDLGRQLVAEMNRLGVLVDLSHASDAVVADVFETARAPVIFSHSSCRALVDNVRNVTDDQLRELATHGGVLMINVYSPVVNRHLTPDVMAAVHDRVRGADRMTGYWDAIESERAARGLPRADVRDVLDHIDHAVRIAGIDHVGLGTDFDGIPTPPDGLEDVTRLPWITYGLVKRGYAEADIRKILGGNALRVLREAEAVAKRLG